VQPTSKSKDGRRFRLWIMLWKPERGSVDNRGDKFARRMSCSVLLAVMSLTPTVCGAGDRTDGRLDCRRLAKCLACTRVDLACCLTCVPGTGGSGNPGRRPCWVLTVVVAVTLALPNGPVAGAYRCSAQTRDRVRQDVCRARCSACCGPQLLACPREFHGIAPRPWGLCNSRTQP